jgi:hypothetical protein
MNSQPLPDSGRLAGVIRTAELLRAGVSEAEIRRLKERRVLVAVARGIYARAQEVANLSAIPGGVGAIRIAAGVAVAGPSPWAVTSMRPRFGALTC